MNNTAVLMDDHSFPSYTTSKVRQKHHVFGETGDAFVRELDFSRITLRLVEKVDKDGDVSMGEAAVPEPAATEEAEVKKEDAADGGPAGDSTEAAKETGGSP